MRIYQPYPLKINQEIELDEHARHHAVTVLRAKVGDELAIFNGLENGEYHGVIIACHKKKLTVVLKQFITKPTESSLDLTLAQGFAKGEKMDFIIQKAVELGIKKIVPIFTERSNVRLSEADCLKRKKRFETIAIHAAEQSGRVAIPEIVTPLDFKQWLPEVKADHCYLLSVQDKPANLKTTTPSSIVLLIGPEGGLTQTEEALAIAKGFTSLHLGPRVLRTETAGLVAITLMQAKFGDMSF